MHENELIFITNDDGSNARGLKVLYDIAKSFSKNIWSFSPSFNNSGKSHSITINKKIKTQILKKQTFKVDGTPVDCVIVGMKYLAIKKMKPSIILSGVNHGQNLGLDLLYSGTVAAAREGSIQNVQSFSISIEKNKKSSQWNTIKYYLPKIIKQIRILNLDPSIYFNINFPNVEINKIKGCKVVKTGKRKPGELIKISKLNKSFFYYTIPSERKKHKSAVLNEDEYEMKKNYITVTYHSDLRKDEIEIPKKLFNILEKIVEK